MKLSVIIPAYNVQEYISESIESVLQTGNESLEIVVVDDGSTDKTKQRILQFSSKVRLISQENRGPASARNRGIIEAKGQYIGFLDSDDLWTQKGLQKRSDYLDKHSEKEVVLGYTQRLYKSGREEGAFFCSSLGSALFRRRVFNKVGLLDTTLTFGEDTDFFFRVREAGISIGVLPDIVQLYRIHGKNLTNKKTIRDMEFLRVIHHSLQRRKEKTSAAPYQLDPLSLVRDQ